MTRAITHYMNDRQTSRIDTNQTSITALLEVRSTLDFIRCKISRMARLQLEVGTLNSDDAMTLRALFTAEERAEQALANALNEHHTTH